MKININGDPVTKANDWLTEKASDTILTSLEKMTASFWEWLLTFLPDILGYGALFTGVTVILGSILGNGQMIKHLGIYAVCVIIAICLLGGV